MVDMRGVTLVMGDRTKTAIRETYTISHTIIYDSSILEYTTFTPCSIASAVCPISAKYLPRIPRHHSPIIGYLQTIFINFIPFFNIQKGLQSWLNCSLIGLTVAYAELPTNQATVTSLSADGKTVKVEVPAGYPIGDWNDGVRNKQTNKRDVCHATVSMPVCSTCCFRAVLPLRPLLFVLFSFLFLFLSLPPLLLLLYPLLKWSRIKSIRIPQYFYLFFGNTLLKFGCLFLFICVFR